MANTHPLLEIHEHANNVREIRLARPPVNALNAALVAELNAAMDAATSQARAVVLSGQPGMFTGGLDVRELAKLPGPQLLAFLREFIGLQQRIACAPVPVVAAITGHSPAGGTVLAIFCDYRIMAQGPFRIGLNETQVGLTPGEIIYRAFERLIGPRVAADWAVRGALVEPQQALAAGLVDELAEVQDVIPRALAYAQQLLAVPPNAFAITRRIVRQDLVAMFNAENQAQLIAQFGELFLSGETQARMQQLLQPAR